MNTNNTNNNMTSLSEVPPSPNYGGEGTGVRGSSRGLRNNNPLNIRRTKTVWLGQSDDQRDKEFVQFDDILYGFRAAFVIIRTYMQKYGLCSVEQIILRWAPPMENDTEAYIKAVCEWSGLKRDEMLRFSDMNKMIKLVQGMANVENGVIVSMIKCMKQAYLMLGAAQQSEE